MLSHKKHQRKAPGAFSKAAKPKKEKGSPTPSNPWIYDLEGRSGIKAVL
jgi:hypothetical protein